MKVTVDCTIKSEDGFMVGGYIRQKDKPCMIQIISPDRHITLYMEREKLEELKQEIETCLIESSNEAAGGGE